MSDDFGAMKETTKAMWSLGDYSLLAKQLEEASRRLVEACGISPGQEVLDAAAGNGNCSIAAARRGARVVASDLTPAMVQLGQARSAAEGLDIEWAEADVEDLPFEPDRFDCVTSEMFRVAKPRGTVGMANWTPDSLMKKMGDVASRYSPPPPVEVPSPFGWGDEHTVRSRFGGLASSIEVERRALLWEAESWDDMRRFDESFGGRVMAKRMLPPDIFESMEKELGILFREHNQGTEGRVAIPNEYLLLVARKA